MPTLKAGCFLVNKKTKKIALVYREKHNDYSFPKGHVEQGENLIECAVRETAEETKRQAKILTMYEPNVENYTTPSGEQCQCHLFFALDCGKSDNQSTDTHQVVWTDINQVEQKLTSDGLKTVWQQAKPIIEKILNSKQA